MMGLRNALIAGLLALPAAPAPAAKISAPVNANLTKPLTLASLQSLDLGTILLVGTGNWSGATVGMSRAGTFSCTDARLTCTGAVLPAKYRVTGSNRTVVWISAPNVVLTNAADPSQKLTLVVDSPGSIVIPNSGNPGADFMLGGSITVGSSTPAGSYSGIFNVTVNY